MDSISFSLTLLVIALTASCGSGQDTGVGSECIDNVCQNFARCVTKLSGAAFCECIVGFHGQYCELDDIGGTSAQCNPIGHQPYQFGKKEGELISPNYPDDYSNRLDCYYFIGTADAKQIRLTYNDVQLEPDKDFIAIGLGDTFDYGKRLVEYDVESISAIPENNRTVTYDTDKLWLYFFTDRNVVKQGFSITYEIGKY
ncbi:fibropellin-3-like [Amphiura filiformis]|uniref:fibropellin-3-like n=1 Tax=Amphiura filiformis TaxID=82378 RepID=UPI003B21088F